MRTDSIALLPLLLSLSVTPPAIAGEPDHQMSPVTETPSPDFDRLKALAGEWEGTAHEGGGKPIQTRATFKVVSAGSAVMLMTDPGTPHEMVTMFHRDGDALLATHYCAAMNQPRMKARTGSPPGTLAFDFLDGTNLGPHPGRMQSLVLTLGDADHQVQAWTYRDEGRESTTTMDLRRKKG
jgi:hypothetical protein